MIWRPRFDKSISHPSSSIPFTDIKTSLEIAEVDLSRRALKRPPQRVPRIERHVGRSSDHNLGQAVMVDGLEVERLVTGTPTHDGRLHIGHKPRGVRSQSTCSMVPDTVDVPLELS